MDDLVAKNYNYFDSNREDIIKDHKHEYALIHDEKLKGYFPSVEKAIEFVRANKIEFGTFAVQECLTEAEETGYYANWAVKFA